MVMMKIIKNKKVVVIGAIILAAVLGFAGYLIWNQSVTSQGKKSQYTTSQARTGNLILTTTGSGSLIGGQEANLSFSTSGTVAAVHVSVGNRVKAGDVLAELTDIETLQAGVLTAEYNLIQAKKELEDLKENATSALAEAQIAVLDAQEAQKDAKKALKWKGLSRCDEDTTNAYYDAYIKVQQELDKFSKEDYNTPRYITEILPVLRNRDSAYATYVYCAGFTDYEISSSQAELTLADATLKTAQDTLAKLQKNGGLDPDTLALAENTVANAEIALTQAKKKREGATLKAPFEGTVLSVAGAAGDKVDTSTFITVTDLDHPLIVFYIDESDLDKVSVGSKISVIFDALPDKTYSGVVTQLVPGLVTVDNSQALQGTATLELKDEDKGSSLAKGLNALVEVLGGSAENVTLVPVEALNEKDGKYTVQILENNQAVERTVEVGLKDLTYAEIKSGVKPGERVITGTVEVK